MLIKGLTIGHFNTLSGFPDSITNGLFDNRITSLNYFYETIIWIISIEDFNGSILTKI